MHKPKVYRALYLPKSLNDELVKLTKGKTLQNCYYILWMILGNGKREHKNLTSFRPISRNYFSKALGEAYYKSLNILGENGLIDSTEKYSKGECYGYRINPAYFDGDYQKITFSYYQKINSSKEYDANKKELNTFISNFRLLDIPFEKLYVKVSDKVKSISILDFDLGESVEFPYSTMKVEEIHDNWSINTIGYLTRFEALEIAFQKGKELIYDGNRYLIADPEYFLQEMKQFTKMSWTMAIDSLADENTLYAKRNNTNNRLDTNFTNLAGELFEIILSYNGMGESDLRNSQPTLLGHVIKGEGFFEKDIQDFIDKTSLGSFYNDFGNDYKQAKTMVFKTLFGNNADASQVQDPTTRAFIEKYPSVYAYMRNYKFENGKESLAIDLQKLESNLFIDGIYYDLVRQGVPCFTKHDSISFFVADREKVALTIEKHFKKIDFEGKIKTEYQPYAA